METVMISAKWEGRFKKGTDHKTFHLDLRGESLEALSAQIHQYVEAKTAAGWNLEENEIKELHHGILKASPG